MSQTDPSPPRLAVTPPAWETALRGWYQRIVAAFRFELARSLMPARISAWFALVSFPVAIMAIFRYQEPDIPDEAWGLALYLLATESTTLLALLLWVAPAIQVELEGRTWSYLSVRPGGKLAVLCGKYLSGVAWTMSAGLIGLTSATVVVWQYLDSPFRLLAVLAMLQILGTIAYGALFLAIGVLFPHRSMVIAVGFTLMFEVVVSLIPATINQITVQHRLWNLLWAWMNHWSQFDEFDVTLDDQPPAVHLLILAIYSITLLAAAMIGVHRREYLMSSEV